MMRFFQLGVADNQRRSRKGCGVSMRFPPSQAASKTDGVSLFVDAISLSRSSKSADLYALIATNSSNVFIGRLCKVCVVNRCQNGAADHRDEAEVRPGRKQRTLRILVPLALTLAVAGIPSCGSGSRVENYSPNPQPLPVALTVIPSSIALVEGTTTTFSASPNPPQGFSLVWSVSPASGGTITNSGVFTAAQTAEICNVVAAWVPTSPSVGNQITGAATVTVLRPVALNLDLIQAAGAIETSSTTQNAAIVGENISGVTSTDPTGKTQLRSGFPIPVPCTQADPNCH